MKYAFLMTHFGSGGTLLCRLLNTSPKVCTLGASGLVYDHPTVLGELKQRISRYYPLTDNCIYLDKIVMNHHFCCKNLYDCCKFIYLVRSPETSMRNIMLKGYDPEHAADYYAFRLRRICEMAVQTPAAVLLTYEDLIGDRLRILENYLDIKKPLIRNFTPMYWDDRNLKSGEILIDPDEPDGYVPDRVMSRCKKAYDKYFSFLAKRSGLLLSWQPLSWQVPLEASSASPR